ncbi:serine/threonine-protein phosphatase PGAM5, mitochondrial-like [Salvelinus alpinus]|uniref:Serine/threonine-protein phosphatase PGAM5, mitochondrial n=1 Tax=Salvelinus namaycush TaxID=8040 RepID=A0A8U0PJY9_SALNM|nr:serine/threonine-protein phosphatase PGAM5, mitochondrial [Salvelinus alpinus]XP_038826247.1 serine/threonine-protein phosphatase PGAM5, mitochondrial-like [Salvelinus namaycush]XP_055730721.1 serine/threonine-protein phosphatase PGAM5, mitochondrial-like [Salvelinus fontinalis]
MSFRRLTKLVCGLAGGSAVLVAMAEPKGYPFEKTKHNESSRKWTGVGVLQAAVPQTWSPGHDHTVTTSGNGWDSNWDKRDPLALINGKKKKDKEITSEELNTEVENNKPKATRHIFLIRHSQYNLNGSVDKERVLTPLGREQAEYTGQRLAALGLKYDVMVHSTMTRATETASIISKHLPEVDKVSCDLLREGAPIEPVPPISWKPDCVYHEDGARIEAAFRRYIHRADSKQTEDSYEIIVCHANVIRYFVCRALQFPPEGWLRLGLNNGSITWITVRPSGRVGLRMMGDSGFMPPEKLTRT